VVLGEGGARSCPAFQMWTSWIHVFHAEFDEQDHYTALLGLTFPDG
jgi:hypothetical protein